MASTCAGLGDDVDEDGWCALYDNCAEVSNADQADTNGNGIGDACDEETCNGQDDDGDGTVDNDFPDRDGDGVADCVDRCFEQADLDADDDGVADCVDPCPADPGNDADADGVCASRDNCPSKANFGQGDADGDGIGDACDVEVCDGIDNDGDNTIDDGLADADKDGICDEVDVCPADRNNDVDKDGLCAQADNCAGVANSNQLDTDGDGVGDACDLDSATACAPSAPLVAEPLPKGMTITNLVVDSTRNLLYAAVGNTAGGPHANELVAIDPVTKNVIWSVLVGTGPRSIALSDDGSRAYVGTDDNGQVRVVDLNKRAACYQFLVGRARLDGFLYAYDMAVLPGHADTVAVSVHGKNSSLGEGVYVFDHGAPRPSVASVYADAIVAASDSLLYVTGDIWDVEDVGVEEDGAHSAYPPLVDSALSWNQIRYAGGLLYGNDGQVVDPKIPKIVGRFATSGAFALDAPKNEIFFGFRDFLQNGARVDVYDTSTFLLLRSLPLTGVTSAPLQVARFGADGLVLRYPTGLTFMTTK